MAAGETAMTSEDPTSGEKAERPLRADAQRNRARVLEVAAAVFAAEGIGVPIDEIARRAGVGVGTVYRHFPNKEALFIAIVKHQVDRVTDEATELLTTGDAGTSFFEFFMAVATRSGTNRALIDAIAGSGVNVAEETKGIADRFVAVLGELVARAQRAGTLRPDVTARDVKALLGGLHAMQQSGGDPDRMLAVIVDGLRAGGG